MQSYVGFLPIPRIFHNSSQTCMNNRLNLGQIAENHRIFVHLTTCLPPRDAIAEEENTHKMWLIFCLFEINVYLCSENIINNKNRTMNNADFWASVRSIIAEGFTPEGLLKLDSYAEQFISGKLVYQRFSPQEQHGCSAGGTTNVIASLLAGAEVSTDCGHQASFGDFQSECQCATQHYTTPIFLRPVYLF